MIKELQKAHKYNLTFHYAWVRSSRSNSVPVQSQKTQPYLLSTLLFYCPKY